jgi:hypothetical protein
MNRYVSAIARSLLLFASLLSAMAIGTAAFAQQSAVPFVNQPLSPTSVAPGHAAFTLSVDGTGFASDAVVNWNGSARTTTFVSSSQLQATITAADVAKATTALITVTNPSVTNGISNLVYFMVGASSSAVGFARIDIPLTLPSETYISGLAVADFNNDGKLDVAVATSGETTAIEVLLGNGDGTFQAPISTTFSIGFSSLVVGDFNGDGNIDLAAASPEPNYGGFEQFFVCTLLGTGDGHFTLKGNGSVPGWPMVTGDFNADGNLDVVTMAADYEGINYYPAVSLGTGAGPFSGSRRMVDIYAWGVPTVGDFNHDGRLDLAIPGRDYWGLTTDLYVFLGDGNGSFDSPILYPEPGHGDSFLNAGSSAAADINGDGNLDIVTTALGVFLGNENGTFKQEPGVIVGGANVQLADLQLADFNNDNKLDVVLIENLGYPSEQQVVSLTLGNGNGTFQSPLNWAALEYSAYVAVGDFNGDGKLDMVAAGTDVVDATIGETTLSLFLQTDLVISPAVLNFGTVNQGSSSTLVSTLTNTGQANESIQSIQLIGGAGNYTENNDCGATLAPGASCEIAITLTPKQGDALFSASVSITYGGALGSPQSILLTGSDIF